MSTIEIKSRFEIVEFNGVSLVCPILKGEPYVVLKCISDDLKMDYKFVSRRTKKHRRFSSRVIEWTPVEPILNLSNKHSYLCLPIHKIAGWLYDLNPSKANEEVRALLDNYQDKCDDVLFLYFFGGNNNVVNYKEKALPLSSEIKLKEEDVAIAKKNLENTDEFKILSAKKTELSQIKNKLRRLERNFLEPTLF